MRLKVTRRNPKLRKEYENALNILAEKGIDIYGYREFCNNSPIMQINSCATKDEIINKLNFLLNQNINNENS